jgi:uncharacterized protein (UPF0335 family)
VIAARSGWNLIGAARHSTSGIADEIGRARCDSLERAQCGNDFRLWQVAMEADVADLSPTRLFNAVLTLTGHGRAPHRKDQRMTEKTDMTDTVGVAGDRIRSIVERIERLEEEIKDLMEAKKEIFAEAKGEGLDVKVLKEILKIRKQDKDERDEQETLLELYLRAMEAPSSAPLAEAA